MGAATAAERAARDVITGRPGIASEGLPSSPATIGLPGTAVLAMPASDQVLYRLASSPLRGKDFESKLIRERPRLPDEPVILYAGLSMFADVAQAASRTRRSPVLVAEVHLAEGLGFHVAKTLTDPGHYTVWGDPVELLRVSRLVDIDLSA
jgi:hypothetical protein